MQYVSHICAYIYGICHVYCRHTNARICVKQNASYKYRLWSRA